MRKRGGSDDGRLYAMKVLKKATIVQKKKTTEHTKTERQVLEAVRDNPFLVTLHYAFQTDAKLHLILGKSKYIIWILSSNDNSWRTIWKSSKSQINYYFSSGWDIDTVYQRSYGLFRTWSAFFNFFFVWFYPFIPDSIKLPYFRHFFLLQYEYIFLFCILIVEHGCELICRWSLASWNSKLSMKI